MICHYYITQKANLDPQVAHKSFKGQKVILKVKNFQEKLNNWSKQRIIYQINYTTWFFQPFLKFFDFQGQLLAFKRFMWNFRVQIGLLGNIMMAYHVKKSNFGFPEALECNLVFLATVAAFLAFTTLKLKNTEFLQ